MRATILLLALLFISSSALGQGNNEAMGGKTNESKPAPTKKKPVPKPAANQTKPSPSPCGVSGAPSLADKWISLGQSASRHFWYNPHKTSCDAKTGVLKTWMKEEHKNTGGDFALVLYEFKCRANQLRVRTVIEYDEAGNLLDTTNHEDDAWQDVAPGTAGETMMKTVCRRP